MKRRLTAFFAVGTMGFILQLAAIALFTSATHWPYVAATLAGVELAVLHNFCWHERWTWRDRSSSRPGVWMRLARYHAGTGATSLAGNVALTALFVEVFGLPPVAANAGAVAAMSAANFLVADRWVFPKPQALAMGTMLLLTASAAEAQPQPHTMEAWNRYVEAAESGHRPGRPLTDRDDAVGETIRIDDGTIHRWRGAVLIPNLTVDRLLDSLMNPGTPPPQDDVVEARVLAKQGDSLKVYLKLVRSAIVTVTYDTEHDVLFRRHGPNLATSRSVSTRIAETDGGDRGFLWRLNSYWRYVQTGPDVRVELESLSLSRGVPTVLRPVAGPIIGRIARESMMRTLTSLKNFFDQPDRAARAATRIPACSIASRAARASPPAPGVSPCTQIVSTCSGSTVPSMASTVRSLTMRSTRGPISAGSRITAPGDVRGASEPSRA
jgi:putative flippase GtrA